MAFEMKLKHILAITTISAAVILLPACGTLNSMDRAQWALVQHPKRIVRYPANVGKAAGMIVGIPIGAILAFPSALIVNALPYDDETKAWSGLIPFVACYDICTIMIGGIPWCAFGWWGVKKPIKEPGDEWLERLPPGAYVVTENGEMIVGRTSTNTIIRNKRDTEANHGLESTSAPPTAGTLETHP